MNGTHVLLEVDDILFFDVKLRSPVGVRIWNTSLKNLGTSYCMAADGGFGVQYVTFCLYSSQVKSQESVGILSKWHQSLFSPTRNCCTKQAFLWLNQTKWNCDKQQAEIIKVIYITTLSCIRIHFFSIDVCQKKPEE